MLNVYLTSDLLSVLETHIPFYLGYAEVGIAVDDDIVADMPGHIS